MYKTQEIKLYYVPVCKRDNDEPTIDDDGYQIFHWSTCQLFMNVNCYWMLLLMKCIEKIIKT